MGSLTEPFMSLLTINTLQTRGRHQTVLERLVLPADDERGPKTILLLRVDGKERDVRGLIDDCLGHVRSLATTPSYDHLEEALKEMNHLLGKSLGGDIREVSAIVACETTTGEVHISHAGRAEAYLTRGNSTVQITEGGGQSSLHPQFLHIASGSLQPGDIVLLSTERLLRTITPAQITSASHRPHLLETVQSALEAEKEIACIAELRVPKTKRGDTALPLPPSPRGKPSPWTRATRWRSQLGTRGRAVLSTIGTRLRSTIDRLQHDLASPSRKRRVHSTILASTIALFLVIWVGFQLATSLQRRQSQQELEQLVSEIKRSLRTAENRQLLGEGDVANTILNRAEEEVRKIMENESGYFRREALDILEQIVAKREEINHIIRISPTASASFAAKSTGSPPQGILLDPNGDLVVFDQENVFSVILNSVSDPRRLAEQDDILLGTASKRFGLLAFLLQGGSLLEVTREQVTPMKTEDPNGWVMGAAMESYLRFLYLLVPQRNQIYKYERLNNRYGPPFEYNINGELQNAVDMAIDGDIYLLEREGSILKLLRGEQRPFTIRNLPLDALAGATRIVKPSATANLYLLNPERSTVVVLSSDEDLGESSYLKQYLLEGEQVSQLRDLAVDEEEAHLWVMDEKRIYTINLQGG